ncbi:hypothetical protein FB45DRAFT_934312 [Roridomyces roridus]|uniref:Uncharacterized protein n=1 Tax=Roridomyces roridus TaxID=1738132 RepID=A0AAD7BC90_9AGAR|nr:hypothetical protein FB45DRAFT_934312 [Roridomyces roridus]
MHSSATLCNLPVSTGFDRNLAQSQLSLGYVFNSGIPTLGSCFSGLLTLPCDTGILTLHLDNVRIVASLPFDLVLGQEWLRLMQNSPRVAVAHLSSGSLQLRTLEYGLEQSSSSRIDTTTVTSSPIPSFSLVSVGRPDVAHAPSLMPSTRGISVVVARTRQRPLILVRELILLLL